MNPPKMCMSCNIQVQLDLIVLYLVLRLS
uniref:MHVS28AA n=1 Tax=Murine hepatitis virus TaxID=11138 RepID=Q86649_9BETC|nr:MHVS28AA [Murine hepatitis virus]